MISASFLALFFTPAYAESVQAIITNIEPRYRFVEVTMPVEHCNEYQVPIYGTVTGQGATGGDVLAGMIIGGLLGKGITGDDGGAAAGAVMGGVIAADQNNRNTQVVTGHRTEVRCETVYERGSERQLRDYLITYEWNGVVGQSYTLNNYRIGQRIPAVVNLQAR